MKAIVNLSDKIKLEIDERSEMETLHKAVVLSNPRNKCVCGNVQGFYLTSNKDKEGNTYINVKCSKCGARSKLGQYKTGGYFWHDFEVYNPTNTKEKRTTFDESDHSV
jgi:hypothetical protein